jgi:hypothetical protein
MPKKNDQEYTSISVKNSFFLVEFLGVWKGWGRTCFSTVPNGFPQTEIISFCEGK